MIYVLAHQPKVPETLSTLLVGVAIGLVGGWWLHSVLRRNRTMATIQMDLSATEKVDINLVAVDAEGNPTKNQDLTDLNVEVINAEDGFGGIEPDDDEQGSGFVFNPGQAGRTGTIRATAKNKKGILLEAQAIVTLVPGAATSLQLNFTEDVTAEPVPTPEPEPEPGTDVTPGEDTTGGTPTTPETPETPENPENPEQPTE